MRYFHSMNLVGKLTAGFFSIFLISSSLFSGEVATMEKSGAGIFWVPNPGVMSVSLKVVGPNGFLVEKQCDTTDISITEFGTDGLYQYEMVVNTPTKMRMLAETDRNSLAATTTGKGNGRKQSGHFRVADGQPMVDTVEEEE